MDFVIGIFVGALLFWLFFGHKKPSGTFVMDFRDPNKDICRLELDDSLDAIYSKKSITLKVRVFEESSQN